MEKLECIIVHETMPSVPNSASLSHSTQTICAISLGLVTANFLTTEMDYLQTLIVYNSRTMIGSCVHVRFTFFGPSLEEKRRLKGGMSSAALEAILFI